MSADLEREAREKSKYFAKRAFESGLITADMEQISASEHCFYFGFISAATLREKEMAETNAANEHMLASQDGLIEMVNERNDEIATLRAMVGELESALSTAQRFIRDSTWDYGRSGRVAYGEPLGGGDVPPHLADAVIYAYMSPIPAPETKVNASQQGA